MTRTSLPGASPGVGLGLVAGSTLRRLPICFFLQCFHQFLLLPLNFKSGCNSHSCDQSLKNNRASRALPEQRC